MKPSHSSLAVARSARPLPLPVILGSVCSVLLCSGCVAVATHAIRAMNGNGNNGGFGTHRVTEAKCENLVPPITDGYGANGPFTVEKKAVAMSTSGDAPIVFLPTGVQEPKPVIFLVHGYGPNYWQAYDDLINHSVSRGFVVVYGTYPARGATNDQRYDALWTSFMAAVTQFRDRMDLTRVGFVGHSFGGGATPALARKGLREQGWGSQGSFTFILAPWYSFQASNEQLRQYPANLVQMIETYDKDTINDHRMAIDLYDTNRVPGGQFFYQVRSLTVSGCEITADHSTPARNPSLRLKQYGVFRPLDALTDAVFEHSAQARTTLATLGSAPSTGVYQPVTFESAPSPDAPESTYTFKWSASANPRRALETW